MKITFLLPGYPAPIGGYRVVYEYANYLATKGNKISIVHTRTLKQNPAPKNLYKLLRRKTALFLMKIKKES